VTKSITSRNKQQVAMILSEVLLPVVIILSVARRNSHHIQYISESTVRYFALDVSVSVEHVKSYDGYWPPKSYYR
jgi:hypothetical protein